MTTALVLSVLALLIFLLSDFSWSSILNPKRNDFVFEGRNKEYGAFHQRREEPRNVMWALFITCGFVGGLAFGLKELTQKVIAPMMSSTSIEEYIDINLFKQEEKELKEEKKPDTHTKAGVPPSGEDNRPPEVVENGPTNNQKAQDALAGKQLGGDGDDDETGELVGPIQKGNGGNSETGGGNPTAPEIFVANMPEFPGGIPAMMEFFGRNAPFPEQARSLGKTGTVWVKFVVTEEGKVENAMILRGVEGAPELDRVALNAVQKMPHWKPGDNGKEPKAVWMTIPVKFVLQ